MSLTKEYPWMIIAKNEIGTKEIAGNQHNQRIVQYHSTTTLKATTDEVPWCSSFVNWVLLKAGLSITRSAAARSWLKYGVPCKLQYGCIVITKRGNSPTAGHVGFCVRHDDKHVYLLGGNQSDNVKISRFMRTSVIDTRMPVNFEQLQVESTKM